MALEPAKTCTTAPCGKGADGVKVKVCPPPVRTAVPAMTLPFCETVTAPETEVGSIGVVKKISMDAFAGTLLLP